MAATPVSDDFYATALNTGLWSFVNPAGNGSFAITGSNVLLNVPAGSNHDPQAGGADNAARITQAITNVDFQVEAKFDSKPTAKYQLQGITVEQDAANFLNFEFVFDGSHLDVSVLKVIGSTQTSLVTTAITASGPSVWLRVQRSGATWTSAWSSDGSTYSSLNTFTQALTPARIGPFAGNYGSPASAAPGFTASVDYFFNTASPISREDAAGPGLSLVAATVSGTSATISWTTDVPAASRVDYGTSTAYGNNASDGSLVTSHSVSLTGLNCGTLYDFAATSATPSGFTTSPNGTFTTAACLSAPDLTVSSYQNGGFVQGASGRYQITVGNAGGTATIGAVTVTDTLPAGLTATAISGAGWSCSTPPVLTCTRSDALAPASQYAVIDLSVSVATNVIAPVTNLVQVSGGGETNTANDTDSNLTTIIQAAGTGPFSDDFHSPLVNYSLWSPAMAVPDGSTILPTGSNLLLVVTGGVIHDPKFGDQNGALRVLQNIANADFQVEAKFDSKPSKAYQMQGLIAEQDASNYIRFEVVSDGAHLYISAIKVIAGTGTSLVTLPISYGTSIWLRMQKSGNPWTGTWSADGSAYSTIASFSQVMAPARAGVYAGNWASSASASPAFTASVDYFFNTASPILPEDGGGPALSLVSITPSSTSATFTWTTDVAASSQVSYGSLPPYPGIVMDSAQVTAHSETITGLTCATAYNSEVVSATASGSTTSPRVGFVTGACTQTPDLTISKSHTGNFTQGGAGTYTITVTNSGGGPTTAPVTVTDVLPTGLTAAAIGGIGWTCSTPPVLSCSRTDTLAAGASFPPIALTVSVAGNAASPLVNCAQVAGGGESNTANDTASDSTIVGPAAPADLTITQSHTGNFIQGGTGIYAITVTNSGGSATTSYVSVTDTIPAGLSASGATGTGWTCSISPFVICSRSDTLAPGASYPALNVTVSVAPAAPSTVTNIAQVSGGGQTNTANDTASDLTTIVAGSAPDLTIAASHSGTFAQGGTGTYTITVTNSGGNATSGAVTLVDTLPSGLFGSALSGSGWTCPSPLTPSCSRNDSLAPGASYPPLTFMVWVATNAGTPLTNVAQVSGGGETNTANDTVSDPTTIVPVVGPLSDDFHSPQLNASVWTAINPVNDGTFQPTGSNLVLTVPGGAIHDPQFGGQNRAVRLSQTVPDSDFQVEVQFDSKPSKAYQMQGIMAEQDAANYIRFEVVSDGARLYVSAVKVVGGTGTSLVTTPISYRSSVWLRIQRYGNSWTGTWSADGSAYSTITTFTQIMKLVRVGPYAGNWAPTASATPAFAASVDYFFNAISPIVPEDGGGPGLSLIAVSPSSTSGTFTWTTDVPASSNVGYGTTLSYGTIVADNTQVTSHSVTITGLSCATAYDFDVVSATASGTTVSPNGSFTTSACAPVPDLTISNSHSGNFIQGSFGLYTITVSNPGGGSTTGAVTVTDVLPTGLTGITITGAGWNCSGIPALSCSRSDTLAAGTSYPPIFLEVSVAAGAPSPVINTAQVAGGGESNTANDTASDSTIVVPAP